MGCRSVNGNRGYVEMTIGHIGDTAVATAPCPSLEQLMGVVDLNDPCQAANAGLTPPGTTVGAEDVTMPGVSLGLLIPIGLLVVFAVMGTRK